MDLEIFKKIRDGEPLGGRTNAADDFVTDVDDDFFIMRTLSIDIETFSSVDLAKSGVYRYAEAPDFEILLFGYSVDAGPVQVVDFACGEKNT